MIRYADDFVVLVHGTEADTAALREDVARVLAPMGLRLSQAKTTITHMSDGFDFLGFRIQWKRKRGSNKWYVYTFIADRPIRSVKAKIRALTGRTSQQELKAVLIRLNQIMRGWADYFKHAVAKHTFSKVDQFGERSGETDREQSRHRAPDLLSEVVTECRERGSQQQDGLAEEREPGPSVHLPLDHLDLGDRALDRSGRPCERHAGDDSRPVPLQAGGEGVQRGQVVGSNGEHPLAHMDAYTPPGDAVVVFCTSTGKPLRGAQRQQWWARARAAVGRPDLRWCDLRAASAMFLYAHGATATDVQHHLDHATGAAALRYQRTNEQRRHAHATLLAEEFIPETGAGSETTRLT